MRSVSCSAGVSRTSSRTAAFSSSALKIASATPTKSSASSDSTRAARRAVAMRSKNDSAGGRLRRISRSEGWRRTVLSESTALPRVGVSRLYLAGLAGAGEVEVRRAGGADVPDERGPISLLTTRQGRRCRGRESILDDISQKPPERVLCPGRFSVRSTADQQLDARLLDRAIEPHSQRDLRRPPEQLLRKRYVRLALAGIVDRQRLVHHLGARIGRL